MNFVSRADTARSQKEREIPYAQRAKPVRRFSESRVRFLAFSSIFISVLLTTFLANFFFSSRTSVSVLPQSPLDSKNSSLLGHLPYPEAIYADLVDLYPGLKVHKDIVSNLRQMEADATRDGVHLVFLSGFRSIELQDEIFYENKSIRNQIAIERAKVSAPAGYSEHSTGYAIDIGDRYMRETDFEVEFELTPAFRWLKKNAAKYHFVLSFPEGNPQNVGYEPWHWRFEGSVQALKQFERANKKRIEQQLSE